MNNQNQNPIEADPLAAMEATGRLLAVIKNDPALAGAKVSDILRLVPGKRAIFGGTMGDSRPAIFRLLMTQRERTDAAGEWAEMQRAKTYMLTGRYRINAPLALGQDGEVMALGMVEGTPLLTHMWGLPNDQRSPCFSEAAKWLVAYTAPTTEQRGIDRVRWGDMAEKAIATQTHEPLQEIETRILQKMKQLGRKLHRQPWRIAVTHGDFHPNNLLIGADHLTAIDLGGPSKLPIYKDIARFLVHCARRDMLPSGERLFGVDKGGFDAFADAFDMDGVERHGFLPFMIAFEVLFRVEHPDFPSSRIRHALEMADSLFQDLRVVA